MPSQAEDAECRMRVALCGVRSVMCGAAFMMWRVSGRKATPSNTPRSVACSVCTWDGRPPVVSTHVEVGSDGSPAGIRDTSLETAIDPLPSCGCPADMSPGETIAPMNTVETKDLCRDDASLCSGQVTATPLLCGSENYRTEESSNENYRTEESSNNPIPESDAGEEPRAHSTENVDPAKRETTTENMASKIGVLDRPFEIATKTIKGKKVSVEMPLLSSVLCVFFCCEHVVVVVLIIYLELSTLFFAVDVVAIAAVSAAAWEIFHVEYLPGPLHRVGLLQSSAFQSVSPST